MRNIIAKLTGLAAAAWIAAAAPAFAFSAMEQAADAWRAGHPEVAVPVWRRMAAKGDVQAQYALGWAYYTGEGVAKDPIEARRWYEQAAAAGNADALYSLGLMTQYGIGARRDPYAAITLYQRAAARPGGHGRAEFAIAQIYFRGDGVPKDAATGRDWLERAAAHGEAGAQFLLGSFYEEGRGVSRDVAEAYYWYARAAEGDAADLRVYDRAADPAAAMGRLRRDLSPEDRVRILRLLNNRTAAG